MSDPREFQTRDPKPGESKTDTDFFAEILDVTDRELLEALKAVENLNIMLSLIGAPEEVTEKIMVNLSPRAGQLLREDIKKARDKGLWRTVNGEVKIDNSQAAQEAARTEMMVAFHETARKYPELILRRLDGELPCSTPRMWRYQEARKVTYAE